AWMLLKDPPDHTRLRGLVHKAFTPRTVERLRAAVQRRTDSAVNSALDRGTFDLIDTLAYPIPVQVIAELMGVPHGDETLFMAWSRDISPSLDYDDRREVYVRASAATAAFTAYLRDLVAERRRQPGEDLLSALIAAESDGQQLTEHELLATAMLLLVAGHETTVNLIGNGVLALMHQRDQWDALVADPALARTGVEELLRFDSPVQLTARYVLQDTHVLGVPMTVGQEVVAILAAANRDPVRFTDPARLNLQRDATGHLAFGSGIHYCVGAPLARLEGQVIFETLARRLPRLQLSGEPPVYRPTFTLRGLQSLPLRVN
ncbi:MAG: cytochrome P450, partial [Caldilineaceae bacterium]